MAYNLNPRTREDRVDNNSRTITITIVGAVVGALTGYLFFTTRGQGVRRQIEPALENFARELNHFRGSLLKAAGAANEGWRWLNDTLGEVEQRPHYPPARQTSPF